MEFQRVWETAQSVTDRFGIRDLETARTKELRWWWCFACAELVERAHIKVVKERGAATGTCREIE